MDHEWNSQMRRPIAAGASVPVAADYGTSTKQVKFKAVVDDATVGHAHPVAAVRYDDWFGNRFRSSSQSREITPSSWPKGSSEPMPAWMNEAPPP